MRGRITCMLAAAAACAGLACVSSAVAEPSTLKQTVKPYRLTSGELRNAGNVESEVFSEVVHGGDVPWIRLSFRRVLLAPGSRLRVESLADGAAQTLTAATVAQWQSTSAYFNGAAVRVSLIAAPGSTRNAVEIDQIMVGVWETEPESQCGPTDDRVPSDEPARARLLDIGCTASIWDAQSCFITAGHCLSSPAFVDVVEFNVPPSLPNGTIQHPGPEDQYAVTNERDFVNGGVGNDWGVFKVFPNSETGLMPFEAQGAALTESPTLPGPGDIIRVVGYGVDDGTANQTQQDSTGPFVSVSGNRLDYRTDTEGGNSGSAVTFAGNDEVVGVHTHGGCNLLGGANSGTAISHPALQSALDSVCGGGGLGCEDVSALFARCTAAGTLQAAVRMSDNSNPGATLTIAIDGSPQEITVRPGGFFAFFQSPSFPSGAHTVSLVEPAGCGIPDRNVVCP